MLSRVNTDSAGGAILAILFDAKPCAQSCLMLSRVYVLLLLLLNCRWSIIAIQVAAKPYKRSNPSDRVDSVERAILAILFDGLML